MICGDGPRNQKSQNAAESWESGRAKGATEMRNNNVTLTGNFGNDSEVRQAGERIRPDTISSVTGH
jgi:hypothetical protein